MILPLAITIAPLAPETVFNIGPFNITNSMIWGAIMSAILLTLFIMAARRSQLWPKSKLAFWFESLIEFVMGLNMETFGGDKKKTLKHFPLLITYFIFILMWNLSGLLPGIDTITYNGIPIFRSFTTDLNTTLALAVLAMGTVEYYAVKEIGGFGYFKHFFKSPKPIDIFIGANEVFGELMRLVTLTLRLFGVIYGGEALLSAILQLSGNLGWIATVPIMFLEIFFCLVQAYLFMMLTSTYIAMSTTNHDEHEHVQEPASTPVSVGSS